MFYCILKDGIEGDCCGSNFQVVELHVLGNALGIMVHIPFATNTDTRKLILLEVQRSNILLWKHSLKCSPNGAMVIGYEIHYSDGNYQIVRPRTGLEY